MLANSKKRMQLKIKLMDVKGKAPKSSEKEFLEFQAKDFVFQEDKLSETVVILIMRL